MPKGKADPKADPVQLTIDHVARQTLEATRAESSRSSNVSSSYRISLTVGILIPCYHHPENFKTSTDISEMKYIQSLQDAIFLKTKATSTYCLLYISYLYLNVQNKLQIRVLISILHEKTYILSTTSDISAQNSWTIKFSLLSANILSSIWGSLSRDITPAALVIPALLYGIVAAVILPVHVDNKSIVCLFKDLQR